MRQTAGEILLVGSLYLLAQLISAALARSATTPAPAAPLTRAARALPLASGYLLAAAARLLVHSLALDPVDLALALFLFFYILGFVLSAIEAVVFSSGPGPIRPRDFLGAAALSAVLALAAALLFSPPAPGSALAHLRAHFAAFSPPDFFLRLALAAVAYMLAYCLIGSVAWFFVRDYYTDPRHGLSLRVPRARIIIPLQLARGLLATLTILPLIAASTVHDAAWFARLAAALALTSAAVPLLNATQWPPRLRLIHALEIALFSLVYAFALWQLLAP